MYGGISFLVLYFLFFSTSFGLEQPMPVLRGYVLPWYNFTVDIIESPSTVYEGGKSLILTLPDKKLHIDMKLNTRLHAPYYTYYAPSRNPQPSTSQNCHYQGKVEGYSGSFVALSNCEGYHGMIVLNETSTKFSVHALNTKNKVVLKCERSEDFHESNILNPLPKMPFDHFHKIDPNIRSVFTTTTAATTTATIDTATVTSTMVVPVETDIPNIASQPKPTNPTTIEPEIIHKPQTHARDPSEQHHDFEKKTESPEKETNENTLKRIPYRRSFKIRGTFRLKGKDQRGSSSKATPVSYLNEELKEKDQKDKRESHATTHERFVKRSMLSFRNFDDAVRWDEVGVNLEKREINVQHPERSSNYYDIFFGLDPLPGLKENYVEHLIGDYINLLQLYYDRSKLQLNVRLSGAIYFPKERMANLKKDSMNLLDTWAYFSGKHFSKHRDIAFLIANRQMGNRETPIGRGFTNTDKCNLYAAASIGYYMPDDIHNLYDATLLIAHEMGHNIGMTHPDTGECAKDGGTMNPTHWFFQPWTDFSDCHLKQLCCKPGDFQPMPLKLTVGSL